MYYTIILSYREVGATQWHPTESEGPWRKLLRGAFMSKRAARRWALSNGIRVYRLRAMCTQDPRPGVWASYPGRKRRAPPVITHTKEVPL